jgi:hypothetical protein
MEFSGCHIEGTAAVRCDWNDSSGDKCGSDAAIDRAACEAIGVDDGELSLQTEATADSSGFVYENEGWSWAEGTIKAAHWQTGTTRHRKGRAEVSTKAPSLVCAVKAVDFSCNLDLEVTGATPGCGLSGGFTCVTALAANDVDMKWTSEIESGSSAAGTDGIVYSTTGTNARTVGGKGAILEAEVSAENEEDEFRSHVTGSVQRGVEGAEGKTTAFAYVDSTLEAVKVLRPSGVDGISTECNAVSPSNSAPGALGIHLSCGETLVRPTAGSSPSE